MSGVIKSIGNIVKSVVKSPIFKAVLVAAAVYFTAGIAAGAMGSAFAASLPGISTAAEALGVTAGEFAAASGTIGEAAGVLTAAGDSVGAIGSTAEAAAEGAGIVGSGIGADVTTAPLDMSAGAESATPAGGDASSLGIESKPVELGSFGEPPSGAPNLQPVSAIDQELPAPGANPPPASPDVVPQATAQPAQGTPTTAAQSSGDIGSTEGSQTRWGGPLRDVVTQSPPSATSSFFDNVGQWWGKQTPVTQQIIGKGVFGAADAILKSGNNPTKEMAREFDINNANKARIGPRPGQYNGIINSQFSRPQPIGG